MTREDFIQALQSEIEQADISSLVLIQNFYFSNFFTVSTEEENKLIITTFNGMIVS